MTIDWSLFVPGVLLLLFPADRLLSSLVELRTLELPTRNASRPIPRRLAH